MNALIKAMFLAALLWLEFLLLLLSRLAWDGYTRVPPAGAEQWISVLITVALAIFLQVFLVCFAHKILTTTKKI